MVNLDVLDAALARIDANPNEWVQREWRCGTAKCLAGHAADVGGAVWILQPDTETSHSVGVRLIPELVAKHYDRASMDYVYEPSITDELRGDENAWTFSLRDLDAGVVHVADWAQHRLGITNRQARALFRAANTRQDLQAMRDALAADPDAELHLLVRGGE
jgi:hypothetical protein